MRQLFDAARGKAEHDWSIASHLMALIAEVNRNDKRRSQPFRPKEFNPMLADEAPAAKKRASVKSLQMFAMN